MTTDRIRDEDLHDAVQLSAAALARATHWRCWHHGHDEALAWLEAAVLACVPAEGHHAARAPARAPTQQHQHDQRGGAVAP